MSDILHLLEQEMQASIVDINQEKDSAVTINDVRIWFFETEKLIRTTSNLSLDTTAQQAVNQLRYAAHHILKEDNKEANIIEAYKHCKRAYYDTLDLFILTLNDKFQTALVYVEDTQKRINITKKLKVILVEIQSARFNNESRIGYYDVIQKHLLNGLALLEDLSLAVSVSAEAQKLREQVMMLKDENLKLRGCEEKLENEINKSTQTEGAMITKWSFWFAVIAVMVTAVSILFQGSLTDYWRDPITKIEHSLNLEKTPTYPIGKK
ncbi:hypothetical protein SPONN_663 [uncultured Candidatus Thioglobus sp.]|nr:hypothetical protein SPONN_663 [uncultured Candidatus Thioglobus sp.]